VAKADHRRHPGPGRSVIGSADPLQLYGYEAEFA
jgi:hypothetical protein